MPVCKKEKCVSIGVYQSILVSFLIAVFVLTCLFAAAQNHSYSRVTVDLSNHTLKEIAALGIAVDHGEFIPIQSYTSDFSSQEIAWLENAGIPFRVDIEDVTKYYREQQALVQFSNLRDSEVFQNCNSIRTDFQTPTNFSLGSMAGYFTYTEMLAHLDTMASKFPDLISARQPIDTITTWEGRSIWHLKISDNPNVEESEPEVLLNALHHAREPASLSQLIFFMYYLLENYGIDEQVTALVNETKMYFVPCVNPDGYIYNETTEPNGGGLWRKNRRDNGDGTFGVDLNRNYGYFWAYDNNGSSSTTSSNVYRGDSAFSEPETQMMRNFCNHHDFKLAFNYHAYGELLIYPFGYEKSTQTADSNFFFQQGKLMTRHNHYTFGTGDQTVGYIVNGSSDDWMYGDTSAKDPIFSFTPEVGPGHWGFWPPANAIENICKQQVFQNLWMISAALNQGTLSEVGSNIVESYQSELKLSLKHTGLQATGNFKVHLSSLDSFSTIIEDTIYLFLNQYSDTTFHYDFFVQPDVEQGQQISFLVTMHNGVYTSTDTIQKVFGNPWTMLADSAIHFNQWNVSGDWGLQTILPEGDAVFADSPYDVSRPYAYNTMRLKSEFAVNLEDMLYAELTFRSKWLLETRIDYVEVVASTDGGNFWQPLCGHYSTPGGNFQHTDFPIYDNYQREWIHEVIDLSGYLGESELLIGFTSEYNDSVYTDGFYLDDIELRAIPVQPVISGEQSIQTGLNLSQNIPNPVSGRTAIYFNLPGSSGSAHLKISNLFGDELICKELNSASGNHLSLNLSELPSGIYLYWLEQQNLQSETRKMVIGR